MMVLFPTKCPAPNAKKKEEPGLFNNNSEKNEKKTLNSICISEFKEVYTRGGPDLNCLIDCKAGKLQTSTA